MCVKYLQIAAYITFLHRTVGEIGYETWANTIVCSPKEGAPSGQSVGYASYFYMPAAHTTIHFNGATNGKVCKQLHRD